MQYFSEANNRSSLRRFQQRRQIRLHSTSPSPLFSIGIEMNKGNERERERGEEKGQKTNCANYDKSSILT